jgi:hypothetical protein
MGSLIIAHRHFNYACRLSTFPFNFNFCTTLVLPTLYRCIWLWRSHFVPIFLVFCDFVFLCWRWFGIVTEGLVSSMSVQGKFWIRLWSPMVLWHRGVVRRRSLAVWRSSFPITRVWGLFLNFRGFMVDWEPTSGCRGISVRHPVGVDISGGVLERWVSSMKHCNVVLKYMNAYAILKLDDVAIRCVAD